MAGDEITVDIKSLVNLKPEYIQGLNPHALDKYVSFQNEVREILLKGQFKEVCDYQLYLSQEEMSKMNTRAIEIGDWLTKCRKDSGEVSLLLYVYNPFIGNAMVDFNSFLKSAVDRRLEQLKQVATKQEEKARQEAEKKKRLAALEEVNPPLEDAKKQLSGNEYQQFLDSIPGAIDAYLDGSKDCILNNWHFDKRAANYVFWTYTIKERKEKEARHKRADLEYRQFAEEINAVAKKFREELAKNKKPTLSYPPALAAYEPGQWCELELPSRKEMATWAIPRIKAKVPPSLLDYITWELECEVLPTPYATYEVLGIPSLTWCSRIHVLVKVHLKLKGGKYQKTFCGYQYEIPAEAYDLGHLNLGPVEWGDAECLYTPLALLSLLSEGKLEANGIEVEVSGDSLITFSVRGFDENPVEIAESFRQFIIHITKDKSLADGLFAAGMIKKTTATVVAEKSKLPLPPAPVDVKSGLKKVSADDSDVEEALKVMGFKKAEIKKMMAKAEFLPGMSTEEKIKAALAVSTD